METFKDAGENTYHENCYEMLVLLEGSVKMVVENQEKIMGRHDTAIIPPYALHHIESMDDSPCEWMDFKLPAVFVSEFFADRIKSGGVFYTWPEDVMVFLDRIEEFYDLYRAEGDTDEMLYLGMGIWLSAILVFMFRKDNAPQKSEDTENILGRSVAEYIDANLTKRITLQDLCNEFHHSVSYIGKQFRAYAGMPVMTYIRKKKMETARFLIVDRQSKPVDVARELGYTDYSSFYKAYVTEFGVPPKERRKKGDR